MPSPPTCHPRHPNPAWRRIYDINLANALSRIFRKHQLLWTGVGGKFQPAVAARARTVKEFDEAITVHSFGGGRWAERVCVGGWGVGLRVWGRGVC